MTLEELLDATEGATWDQLDTVAQVCIARLMDLANGAGPGFELDNASKAIVRAGQLMRGVA